jgi:hypothetical protein
MDLSNTALPHYLLLAVITILFTTQQLGNDLPSTAHSKLFPYMLLI